MRILLIGDIVGKPGRQICTQAMRGLRAEEKLDLVVANAENVAGGSGLTPEIYHELIAAGIDGITMGDHVYRRREIFSDPANASGGSSGRPTIPADAPGRDFAILPRRQQVQRGDLHACWAGCSCRRSIAPSRPPTACWPRCPPDVRVILVDFHAEATSDKQLMGRHLDGRVTRRAGHPHPRAHRRRADPARRHGLPVRRGHDRPAREHSRPADRPRDGDHPHLPAHPFRGGHRRLPAQRHDRRRRPADRPGDGHPPALRRPSRGGAVVGLGAAKPHVG